MVFRALDKVIIDFISIFGNALLRLFLLI
jgi:hypothetical protein